MRRLLLVLVLVIAVVAVWFLRRDGTSRSDRGRSAAAMTPVHFQHGGLRFDYASRLAKSTTAVERPAQPFVAGEIPEGVGPAHLEVAFGGFAGAGPESIELPVLHIYPVAEFARPEFGPDSTNLLIQEYTLLRELLEAPAGHGGIESGGTAFLPYLPATPDAAQVLHAKMQRLEAPGVVGIRYLTSYAQEMVPLTEGRLFYTFQGLTPDRQHYIAATFPVRCGFLPVRPPADFDAVQFRREIPTYLAHTVADIEAQEDARFTPPLGDLDALVRSIVVAGSAAASPAGSSAR